MEHRTTYRGHEITVYVTEERHGVWSWSYWIDDVKLGGKSVPGAYLMDPDAALRRALLAARARVDELG
jgi:hypothetical protein